MGNLLARNVILALAAVSIAAAADAKPSPPPPPPPAGTYLGGCDPTLPGPDASACAGYYSKNILGGSAAFITDQQNAIASLPGPFTWDGNWNGLQSAGDVITTLTNGNELNFGKMLYGQTIIGAHFGNIDDNTGHTGNVSVFWLFDFGPKGKSYITLDNTRGFSNAALYTTGAPPSGVPEPATWAMMLIGFGAAGVGLRRRRSKTGELQLAGG